MRHHLTSTRGDLETGKRGSAPLLHKGGKVRETRTYKLYKGEKVDATKRSKAIAKGKLDKL